jgi:hypothetical protein
LWCYVFFPNPKLQNAKISTVSFPNFKSSNGQIFELSNFRNVICSTDQMFNKSLFRIAIISNCHNFELP